MATVVRAPLFQGALRHPAHLGLSVFQPNNLLTSTLVAATLSLPARNNDALAWTQIQHPSRLGGYLNLDTSRGTPKTLIPEFLVPPLLNPDAQAWMPVQHPSHLAGYLNPDTSRGTPKTLVPELTPPAGRLNLFLEAPEPPKPKTTIDVTGGIMLAVPPPPVFQRYISSAPHLLRINLDTSVGTPKTLRPETSLPVGRRNMFLVSPEPQRSDTSAIGIAQGIMVVVPPPPFFQPQLASAPQLLRINIDTSRGIPKTLAAEASLPVGRLNMFLAPPPPRRTDTSVGHVGGIMLAVPPPPIFPQITAMSPHRLRINLDTSASTPKTLINEQSLPIGFASNITAQRSMVRYFPIQTDTSAGSAQYLFTVAPFVPVDFTPLFIANMGKMMSRH